MKRTSGISLMLLIFLSLCLITFSLLSLSGAAADSRLSQKSAERTTEYYTAVTAVNELLSKIDTQLAACLKEAEASEDPEQTYLDACAHITVEGAGLTWISDDGDASSKAHSSSDNDFAGSENVSGSDDNSADSENISVSDDSSIDSAGERASITLSFDINITEDQYLHMELIIVWPETGTDTLYQITSQKVVSTQEWSADTSLNLYRTGEGES